MHMLKVLIFDKYFLYMIQNFQYIQLPNFYNCLSQTWFNSFYKKGLQFFKHGSSTLEAENRDFDKYADPQQEKGVAYKKEMCIPCNISSW